MSKRILIVQGHPDRGGGHFGHALSEAYARGAQEAGHEVKTVNVAQLDFSFLRTREEWEEAPPAEPIRRVQDDIGWADHMAIFYPLWLGTMPALVKAFLEHVLRPGFAIDKSEGGRTWRKGLTGKSARVVVTMGMPAFVYRWYFRAHSLKSLERNILGFCGIKPIRESLIGMVEAPGNARRARWLGKMQALGRKGA